MRALYPASNDSDSLPDYLLDIKIARHTPCSICADCSGLHPSDDIELTADDKAANPLTDLAEYGSDDDDDATQGLSVCACGHIPRDHGAFGNVDRHEYNRRALIAVRLDDHLQRAGKLLDFTYVDEAINALRHEMLP
ncbi:hypothetical protein K488DRAFT_34091, partial [Vararia minispora EC-137]